MSSKTTIIPRDFTDLKLSLSTDKAHAGGPKIFKNHYQLALMNVKILFQIDRLFNFS